MQTAVCVWAFKKVYKHIKDRSSDPNSQKIWQRRCVNSSNLSGGRRGAVLMWQKDFGRLELPDKWKRKNTRD